MRTQTDATPPPCTNVRARGGRTPALILAGPSILVLCLGGCGEQKAAETGPLPTPGAVTSLAQPAGTAPTQPATLTVLQGFVSDGLRVLSNVAIDIVDGPLAGTTTLTDSSGKFAFSEAMALPVTVRLRRDGYVEKREVIRQKLPSYVLGLESLEAPFNFESGNYILRVSLDASKADSWFNLPQAPCAGIPAEALTHRFNANVSGSNSSRLVTITGEGLAFPSTVLVTLGNREAAVVWDTIVPIDKDLGSSRYVQIQGADSPVPGPISSSGSTVSISTPVDLMYCRLSRPRRAGDSCSVPSDRIEHHACTWDRAVLQFDRQ